MERNKSLDKHPTFILLSSFALGATLMWGILIFTLNDNREYLHKAEIENIKAQIGNKQSEIHILIQNLRSCFEFLQKVFLGLMYPFSCVLWAIFWSFSLLFFVR